MNALSLMELDINFDNSSEPVTHFRYLSTANIPPGGVLRSIHFVCISLSSDVPPTHLSCFYNLLVDRSASPLFVISWSLLILNTSMQPGFGIHCWLCIFSAAALQWEASWPDFSILLLLVLWPAQPHFERIVIAAWWIIL